MELDAPLIPLKPRRNVTHQLQEFYQELPAEDSVPEVWRRVQLQIVNLIGLIGLDAEEPYQSCGRCPLLVLLRRSVVSFLHRGRSLFEFEIDLDVRRDLFEAWPGVYVWHYI